MTEPSTKFKNVLLLTFIAAGTMSLFSAYIFPYKAKCKIFNMSMKEASTKNSFIRICNHL